MGNTKVTLGQRVKFSRTLHRVKNGLKRTWVNRDAGSCTGIIIGLRNLKNGYITKAESDDGTHRVFNATETKVVYLVATNLRDNPIYVATNRVTLL